MNVFDRRAFLETSGMGLLATAGMPKSINAQQNNSLDIFGPRTGYTPHISILVSMLDWMRNTILYPVRGMDIKDLDFLIDENANSIGAMLYHLAATERFYQLNTFENRSWGDWPKADADKFQIAMSLGSRARNNITGKPLSFYLELLESVRETTLAELKQRDDEWLMAVDENFGWGPTNNYCKWFHVCEHESNHNGQIKFIKSRIA